jgi:hypothetical protein
VGLTLFNKSEEIMSKNVCYGYLLLSWIVLSGSMAVNAQEVSPKPSNRQTPPNSTPGMSLPDSDDFARRVIISYLFLQDTVALVKGVTGELESNGQTGLLVKPLDVLQENLLVRLTLAKYFTSQEMETFIEFLDTAEVVSMLTKITQHLVSPKEPVQRDIENLVQEVKAIYFMTITKGWLGKTTDDTSFSPPLKRIDAPPFTSDKIEVRDRLIAARQVVESCLALIEGTMVRILNQRVKDEVRDIEVEGARISLAVRSMMEDLREDPVLVLMLARHFDAKELSVVASFLSKEEIRLGVDRLSRLWVSPQGGQLLYDLKRLLQEFTLAFAGIFDSTHNQQTDGTETVKKAKGESGKTEATKPKAEKAEAPGGNSSQNTGSAVVVPGKKEELKEAPPEKIKKEVKKGG